MGEQGAESLYTHLHSLERNFSGISNELDRLKHIFYRGVGIGGAGGATGPSNFCEGGPGPPNIYRELQ